MNDSEKPMQDEPQLDAPKALRDDLGALFAPGPAVPEEVDEAVRAMARRRLSPERPARPVVRWLWSAAAAAAVLLIVFWPRPISYHERPPAPTKAIVVARPGDVDGSGRVDVLDAFALARHIERREALRPEWDINRDDRVDEDDVDAIAMNAVSLSQGAIR